jgi:putative transposase
MEIDPLVSGYYYHIYNQGINKEKIFKHEEHYLKFLTLCEKYLFSQVDVYAYCLMPNHFHFLVYVPEPPGHPDRVPPPCQGVLSLSHLFNAYAQWFNKQTNRTGGLFRRPFRRKRITDDFYFMQVLYYIHRNPIHHKLAENIKDWIFSSYHVLTGDQPTRLKRDQVLEWFGGRKNFIDYHDKQLEIDDVDILESSIHSIP